MAPKYDELEFVAWMAGLGKRDRDLYRQLRNEAWAMAQLNHAEHSEEQRSRWLDKAS